MNLTLTEIRDTFTRLINEGHGNEILRDDNDPHFAVCGINVSKRGTVTFDCDEVE